MARLTSQEAANAIGGDQFLMVIMAAQRSRELANGSIPRVDTKGNGHNIVAIREIEKKKYTKEEFYQSNDKKGQKYEHQSSQSKRNPKRDTRNNPFY